MADEALHSDELGELRGQVRGLQSGFNDLGRKLDEGLKGLTDYIRTSSEKTDQRIDAGSRRTDERFEALAQSQLMQLGQRGSAQWTVFAYIGSTVFALAGLAATFYSITRGPIDASFAELKATTVSLSADIKSQADRFVPVAQSKIEFADLARRDEIIGGRVHEIEHQVYLHDAQISAIQKALDQVRTDQKDIQATTASKTQVSDLNERITTTSNRLQTVYDKNYTPSTSSTSPPPIAGSPGR